jgi:hypothetical protein
LPGAEEWCQLVSGLFTIFSGSVCVWVGDEVSAIVIFFPGTHMSSQLL